MGSKRETDTEIEGKRQTDREKGRVGEREREIYWKGSAMGVCREEQKMEKGKQRV